MKLNGFVGKGSGKLGASVFAISGGEQIVRQYNPQVSNPSTPAQVEQRAKLKLMSQLAADLAPAIAIKKQGLKSARNIFVSKNIARAEWNDGEAELNYAFLQLTDGNLSIPTLDKVDDTAVQLASAVASGLDRVAYVFVKQDETQQLSVTEIRVVEAGENDKFTCPIDSSLDSEMVFAYGLKYNSANAKIRYEDYFAELSQNQAALVVDMSEVASVATTTKTVFLSLE